MNAVDYLREKSRMCNALVCNCPMSKRNNGKGLLCGSFEKDYPEQAIEIVEKWAKEHPVKTYTGVLLEKFPNTELNDYEIPMICIRRIFGSRNFECSSMSDCADCWNREYKEEE